MADKKKADKKGADKSAEKAPGGRMKLIILIVILLLLLAGGGGAAYYFLWYGKSADESGDAVETETEATSEVQAEEGAPAAPVFGPLTYHELESFTVNLSPGSVRFLRANMTIATPNPEVIAAVDRHMPMLRNDILSVLAAQEFATLNTAEGKDTLREELRQTMVRLLARSREPSEIHDVLFNELIMQ
ncbi:flagellar basal body-associated FliL family protein [Allochromatium palmeri]|uniref:Flagellar protein FliL n=1 Tax=Allochromatium palmeri TaxID=231048 RepID=A0A6N8EBP2_9GAMM|nr:flagellar basal body-associated FliL family protein [Allochromatium palmeri]MTW20329.1 flagellar basal body protein FliL [Allochromatium palmeri]